MNHTKALFDVVNHNVATINGTMDYDRVTDTIISLCDAVMEEEETDWYIGEYGEFCLADLITGAFWHYTEWHGGQYSKGYLALSQLGRIFDPGMTCAEDDNAAYELLNNMAGK